MKGNSYTADIFIQHQRAVQSLTAIPWLVKLSFGPQTTHTDYQCAPEKQLAKQTTEVYFVLNVKLDCFIMYYCVHGEKSNLLSSSMTGFHRTIHICDWVWKKTGLTAHISRFEFSPLTKRYINKALIFTSYVCFVNLLLLAAFNWSAFVICMEFKWRLGIGAQLHGVE